MSAGVRILVSTLATAGLVAAALAQEKPADSITGRVTYTGTPPKPKQLNPASDPHCAKTHEKEPLVDESLAVSKDGGLKNVFVQVTGGLPKDKKYDPPAYPVILDQRGCMYRPHVIGVQTGQVLQVVNSDDTNHNVHGVAKQNKEFNKGQARKGIKDDFKLTQPEIFKIKCDVHQWMGAWAHVVPHPFFAVTDDNGAYAIKGLPPGDYELTYYLEGKKFNTQKVKVEAGKPTQAEEVKYSPPGKKPPAKGKAPTPKADAAEPDQAKPAAAGADKADTTQARADEARTTQTAPAAAASVDAEPPESGTPAPAEAAPLTPTTASWWLPPNASEHGRKIDALFTLIFVVTGTTLVLVFSFLAYLLIKYRRRPGRRVAYIHGNHRLEVIWTLTPAVLLVVMGILSLRVWADVTLNPPDPSKEPTTDVEVLAQQFQWNIRYPGKDGRSGTADDIGSFDPDPEKADRWIIGDITVPVNRPVRVYLMSKDVLHSFFLPHMRMKRDAVPGLRGQIYFRPTQTGKYELACAELCGPQHYSMSGWLKVLNQQDYDKWLAERYAEVDERLAEEGGQEATDAATEEQTESSQDH